MLRACGPVIALLLLLLASCAGEPEPKVELGEPRAELHGVIIPFTSSEPLAGVRLRDAAGATLQEMTLPDLRSGELLLPAGVAAKAAEAEAILSAGGSLSLPLDLPSARGVGVELRSAFAGVGPLLVPAGEGGAEVQVVIGGRFGETLGYRVELTAGGDLTLAPADGGAERPGARLVLEGGSRSYVRPLWRRVRISAEEGIEGRFVLTASAVLSLGGEEAIEAAQIEAAVMPVGRLAAGLEIARIEMPVAADGSPLPGRKENSISLGGSSGEVAVLAHQAVALRNRLDFDVPVVIVTTVAGADGDSVPGFGDIQAGGAATRIAAILRPGIETVVIAPIPGDRSAIEPGEYSRRVSLRLADSGLEVAAATLPLEVERTAYLALAVTCCAAAIALALVALALLRGGRFLSGFTARQLVLVALVAASSVVLVNLPMFFLSSITTTLLGPLGMLVDALLSQFLFGSLMVALITVIPRQGVCAMVTAIRFLLGGVLLGMLTPVGLLLAAVSIAALEGAVWLSRTARRRTAVSGLALILLFALANALISWVGFQLAVVLFRLYYADWYVALSVLLSGFIYSLVGAATGRRLGLRLAQVAA